MFDLCKLVRKELDTLRVLFEIEEDERSKGHAWEILQPYTSHPFSDGFGHGQNLIQS